MRCTVLMLLVVCAFAGGAQDFDIVAFDETNGDLTWESPVPGEVYRVQWASDPGGPWLSSWDSLVGIVSSDATTTVNVPAFFRVVRHQFGGMALVPAGVFTMGDTFTEGGVHEQPLHDVFISAFYMDQYEVTKGLWDEVRAWGLSNGYTDLPAGGGKGPAHPVHSVSWYDAVKWCNARSKKEKLTPCYYTTAARSTVYQTGDVDLWSDLVLWSADGYRLPTEAEWEKAARGGNAGRRFPWSGVDTIEHALANYRSWWSGGVPIHDYDVSPSEGYHPDYDDLPTPYTSPVGSFAANDYGLYDMAGNVGELCYDSYSGTWYAEPGATDPDTRGPTGPLSERILRSAPYNYGANNQRCANREVTSTTTTYLGYGFRCVRGQ